MVSQLTELRNLGASNVRYFTVAAISRQHYGECQWMKGWAICLLAIMMGFSLLASDVFACSEHCVSSEQLAPVVAELKAKAKATGRPVRVIVEVGPSPVFPVPTDPEARRRAVVNAKSQLTNIMRCAGAVVEPIANTAMSVMELSAPQIDLLVSTGMVLALQEDVPER